MPGSGDAVHAMGIGRRVSRSHLELKELVRAPQILNSISPIHRPLSSFFLGVPYRLLNINHNKELLRGLCLS